MSSLTLYHGTDNRRLKPTMKFKNICANFGNGFYLTDDVTSARIWSKNEYSKKPLSERYVIKYNINTENLNILDFRELAMENWVAELIHNRISKRDLVGYRKKIYDKFLEKFKIDIRGYDILIGDRFDSGLLNYIYHFLVGDIPLNTIDALIAESNLGIEYCIKTQDGLNNLKVIEIEHVSDMFDNAERGLRNNMIFSGKNSTDNLDGWYVWNVIS